MHQDICREPTQLKLDFCRSKLGDENETGMNSKQETAKLSQINSDNIIRSVRHIAHSGKIPQTKIKVKSHGTTTRKSPNIITIMRIIYNGIIKLINQAGGITNKLDIQLNSHPKL